MQQDAQAQRDPYGRTYAPHKPATIKRWGPHAILNMSGEGIGSLKATPLPGAGITLEAAVHMAFTQAGTPTQTVRAVLPNRPQLPATYERILEESAEVVLRRRLEASTR
jgi:hypothetical protein